MSGLSPTQTDVFTALRAFLLAILPTGIEVIKAQVNRVPEPKVDNFVVMTAIRRDRLETNIDEYDDVAFTGSIAGTVMTVTAVEFGTIRLGAQVFGAGIAAGTQIVSFDSGSGGVGTYNVSPAQTVTSKALAAGVEDILQPTRVTVQLDVHGPASADNAQIISTLFRDSYGTDAFAALNAGVIPLFADDPKQIPFENEQKQIETRWVIDAVLQVNQTVAGLPQQFAAEAVMGLIDVDATYPA
jgi:hypothetical protein